MFSDLFGWIPAGIEAILLWLTSTTGSAGLAIILITLGIRLALYPLTLKQTRSMAAMKELQPKLEALKKKYGNNPQEYQKRMMELYQQEGVNPFGSCLPLLVQFPFLIALYQVLMRADFGGADPNFLIWDLTKPDSLWILPILSALTTYFQTSMTVSDPSQKAMLYIMPVFIGWISLRFPAGLVLYWTVSNLFSIGQQYVLMKERQKAQGGADAK